MCIPYSTQVTVTANTPENLESLSPRGVVQIQGTDPTYSFSAPGKPAVSPGDLESLSTPWGSCRSKVQIQRTASPHLVPEFDLSLRKNKIKSFTHSHWDSGDPSWTYRYSSGDSSWDLYSPFTTEPGPRPGPGHRGACEGVGDCVARALRAAPCAARCAGERGGRGYM